MDLEEVIREFNPVSLEELNQVKLLNRTDTKFFFSRAELLSVLMKMQEEYSILSVDGVRFNQYKTLYFDTEDHRLYLLHHNEKNNRDKVRMRQYVNSRQTFLEVKHKTGKGRTIKKRVKIDEISTELTGDYLAFVEKLVGCAADLKASLWNSFVRLTFVDKARSERVTFDLDLSFTWGEKHEELPNLVIAEVKQDTQSRHSKVISIFKGNGIRSNKISKYCTGTILTNDGLKYNRFKAKLLKIKKIENDRKSLTAS